MQFAGRCALATIGGMSLMIPTAMAANDSKTPIADAINDFTFRLVRETGVPTDKNVLISPFSVSTAMGMLLPGTQPADQTLLLKAIAPRMSARAALAGYGNLSRQMTSGATATIANSMWVDSKMKLNPAYPAAVKASFSAGVFPFSHNAASLNKINGWVDGKTKHRIPKILDSIKDADRVFLINAIAFDGLWEKQFDVSRTFGQEFHPIGKAAASVPMMHMSAPVGYVQNDNLTAIKLNYKGGTYSMLLMLPEKGKDAGALLKQLNPAAVNSILSSLDDSDEVEIALPKFKFSDSYQLAGPLAEMGLGKFFNDVDFSKISPQLREGLISTVIHKTFIEVDEKGTKAAAATGVVMQPTMVRMNAPKFIADRPFAFLIIHNPSHAILFASVVNKP